MPASTTKTFRLSHALADAMKQRARDLGYPSGTALIEALARYDCLCQSAHGVTKSWAQLTLPQQDDLDARLLTRVQQKRGMPAHSAAKLDWQAL